jgi:phage terminase small subunit
MSRQSAAALAIVPTDGFRVEPTVDLDEGKAALWRSVVESLPPGHFHASDEPLLRRYVETVALVEQAQAQLAKKGAVNGRGKISPWLTVFQRASRQQISLAMALRLAPQARIDRRKAGAATRPGDSSANPWAAKG